MNQLKPRDVRGSPLIVTTIRFGSASIAKALTGRLLFEQLRERFLCGCARLPQPEAKDENAQPCCCAHPGLKALEALHEKTSSINMFSVCQKTGQRPTGSLHGLQRTALSRDVLSADQTKSIPLVKPSLKNGLQDLLVGLLRIVGKVWQLYHHIVEPHKGKRQRIEIRIRIVKLFGMRCTSDQ